MRIGLIRHFKVKHEFPTKFLLTKAEIGKWFEEYESAAIEYKNVDLGGIEWKKCFSSPLERAAKTADAIYTGEITKSNELMELDFLPLMNKYFRFPLILWAMLIKRKSLSSNKVTKEFIRRINVFIDELLLQKEDDVLVVSHGFVMLHLQKELIKRGFKGNKFKTPENAKLYIFEK